MSLADGPSRGRRSSHAGRRCAIGWPEGLQEPDVTRHTGGRRPGTSGRDPARRGHMDYRLGVDLGTTYTAAAILRGDEPEMVSLGDRELFAPSVIVLNPDGSVLVGDPAEQRAPTASGRTVREFKARLGDATPVVLGGVAYSPESLMATLLRWVLDVVDQREGGPPVTVAVTYPAGWAQHRRDRLAQVLAGGRRRRAGVRHRAGGRGGPLRRHRAGEHRRRGRRLRPRRRHLRRRRPAARRARVRAARPARRPRRLRRRRRSTAGSSSTSARW